MSGGRRLLSLHLPGDCILQNSAEFTGCEEPLKQNFDVYVHASRHVEGYKHFPKKCVIGFNIEKHERRTRKQCQALCDKDATCVAFEYGMNYGGSSGNYKPGDCQLSSHSDYYGCDGANFNLDLYVKSSTVDLLKITRLYCKKNAGGISSDVTQAFGALGAVVAGGLAAMGGAAAVFSTGGAFIGMTPATAKTVALAAAGGYGTAKQALSMLDGTFAGVDNLLVQVDGKQVLRRDVDAGEAVDTSIQVTFQGHARISLIEVDSGSDNDDLGSLDVFGGASYAVDEAIVPAPADEDGSIYYLNYEVQNGMGDPASIVNYMLCGTNQCAACSKSNCEGQGYDDLDRDGDKEDLKHCPPGFTTSKFEKYEQIIVADVYLRVCKRI
eukprot:TRINITY_DN7584_c0_g1_i1.p2 TRINITY_DN7584_c0_g1~~TRINITY_DN7584_c0_g1_i1.p2  ORF type:complete len:382 (-),score=78.06 TRINITY_DN7584_c0_g1_i1:290-1435(-)